MARIGFAGVGNMGGPMAGNLVAAGHEVASRASGQCWALTSCCPVPGLVDTAPSNDGYRAGFSTAMMTKDMGLALEAAERAGARVDVARAAASLYAARVAAGEGGMDFSAVIETVRAADALTPAAPRSP